MHCQQSLAVEHLVKLRHFYWYVCMNISERFTNYLSLRVWIIRKVTEGPAYLRFETEKRVNAAAQYVMPG